MTEEWRKPCEDGCTCGKHQAHLCPPGCTCSRHSAPWKFRKCPKDCTCGRHRRPSCPSGCTCDRHRPAHNRYTPEQAAIARERRLARGREYMRRMRQEDPEKFRRKATSDKQRGYSMKCRQGITVEQWNALFQEQGGRCYLCRDPLAAVGAHVDHDHVCCPGKKACGSCVRGLACRNCNQGIGQFGDDPERMRRAADNLEAANRRLRARA